MFEYLLAIKYTADATFIKEYNSMVPTDYEGKVTGVWDVNMQIIFRSPRDTSTAFRTISLEASWIGSPISEFRSPQASTLNAHF